MPNIKKKKKKKSFKEEVIQVQMLKRKKIKTSPSDSTSRTLVALNVVSIKERTQKHQVTMGGERQYRWLPPLGG